MTTISSPVHMVLCNKDILSCIFEHIPVKSETKVSIKDDPARVFAATFLSFRALNRSAYKATQQYEFLVSILKKIDRFDKTIFTNKMRWYMWQKNHDYTKEQLVAAMALKIRYRIESMIFMINNLEVFGFRQYEKTSTPHWGTVIDEILSYKSYRKNTDHRENTRKICKSGTFDQFRFAVAFYRGFHLRTDFTPGSLLYLVTDSCVEDPSRIVHLKYVLSQIKKHKDYIEDYQLAELFSQYVSSYESSVLEIAINNKLNEILKILLSSLINDLDLEVKYIQEVILVKFPYDQSLLHRCVSVKNTNKEGLEILLSTLKDPKVGLTSEQRLDFVNQKSYNNSLFPGGLTVLEIAQHNNQTDIADIIKSFIATESS